MEHLILEVGLALALSALAGMIAGKLRISIVPILIIAGMVVGPQAPHIGVFDFRFIQSAALIDFMGKMGVLFLLFSLGLEFSIKQLMASGPSILRSGLIYMLINFSVALLYPLLLGWPIKEILVVAGMMTISSSAIVAKVIVELKRAANDETEIILGLMMFQDVFVAIYLSVVSGLVLSGSTSTVTVLLTAAVALGFIGAFLFLGHKLVPWLNRRLDIPSDETFLLVTFAAVTLVAGISETLNIAQAIGAMLLGLVLAETEHRERIEHIIVPFRDFFGALFFFSFGLSIDPFALGGAVWPVLGAVLLTLLGNTIAGFIAGRRAQLSHRASLRIGLTILSRGEFSIILTTLALSGGLLGVLQPFSALYVLILAILGPILTKESSLVYKLIGPILKWPELPEKRRLKL
ncbi:sodium-hydrogen exchanger [Dehalobacter sp. UNSWDHB]|jgi:Kef-type K+ transport systems, membrane components|uniref:cation:proton antiporter n=1 Tax=unclassified Dehalobacter TaxID=2635733 RepID=UPI00028BBF0A|nr:MULTISPECIES: cation:proton antiporter [unclassified Dehalobacter]AFV01832.1 Na+/H+ antiporter [Dehalobacter sp. DCA]AFV04869.1 sodium/hydrogen exchanger [Dehalobacter sp. CF]EQB20658.1 sodium-hydrogen exchanger [Dehalobacter sp. UNSWDHB]